MMYDNVTRPYQYHSLVSSIEECITYNNEYRIYMSDGDWYLVRTGGLTGSVHAKRTKHGTSLYHRHCTSRGGPPFVHFRRLVCQRCSAKPPDGIVGVFVLHNWEEFQGAD